MKREFPVMELQTGLHQSLGNPLTNIEIPITTPPVSARVYTPWYQRLWDWIRTTFR